MRTLIISYDLAQPHRNKLSSRSDHGDRQSWARPLEQTWYVRTDAREDQIEASSRHLDREDGLLIQATRTRRCCSTRRCAGSVSGAPGSRPVRRPTSLRSRCRAQFADDQQELPLPLAEAC